VKPYYQHAGITIYHGDCREALPDLEADALLTDPPYGVGLSGKAGHYRNKPDAKREDTYASYDDTPENLEAIVIPALVLAISRVKCGAVFMAGRNIWRLPPGELGGIFLPSGCGRTAWGFQNFMHCVFYGKDPYTAAGMGSRPNGKYGLYGNDSNKIAHPCAKPLDAIRWAVTRVSLPGQVVLDPFMGSGTTLHAAKLCDRSAIGIEIHEQYCEIAAKRLQQEVFDFPHVEPTASDEATVSGEAKTS
jgi:site-specific DNA-methyltransferase (adenine-specific)